MRKVRKNELKFYSKKKKSYVTTILITSFLRQETIYNVSKKAVKLREDESYMSKKIHLFPEIYKRIQKKEK